MRLLAANTSAKLAQGEHRGKSNGPVYDCVTACAYVVTYGGQRYLLVKSSQVTCLLCVMYINVRIQKKYRTYCGSCTGHKIRSRWVGMYTIHT